MQIMFFGVHYCGLVIKLSKGLYAVKIDKVNRGNKVASFMEKLQKL
jgi:hypothetical protein